MQIPGATRWAYQVITALNDGSGDLGEAPCQTEDLIGLEEGIMLGIMAFDARERECRVVQTKKGHNLMLG
jgi:hypothetical protein